MGCEGSVEAGSFVIVRECGIHTGTGARYNREHGAYLR